MNYLHHVRQVWDTMFRGVHNPEGRISADIIGAFHLRTPHELSNEPSNVREYVLTKFNESETNRIMSQIRDVEGPIPTVRSYFDDVHLLGHWISIMSSLLDLDKTQNDLCKAMRARWKPEATRECALDEAIDHCFLYVMWHLYSLDPEAVRLNKSGKRERSQRMERDPEVVQELCQRLRSQGFNHSEMDKWIRVGDFWRQEQTYFQASQKAMNPSRREKDVPPLCKRPIGCRSGKPYLDAFRCMTQKQNCPTSISLTDLRQGTLDEDAWMQLYKYCRFRYGPSSHFWKCETHSASSYQAVVSTFDAYRTPHGVIQPVGTAMPGRPYESSSYSDSDSDDHGQHQPEQSESQSLWVSLSPPGTRSSHRDDLDSPTSHRHTGPGYDTPDTTPNSTPPRQRDFRTKSSHSASDFEASQATSRWGQQYGKVPQEMQSTIETHEPAKAFPRTVNFGFQTDNGFQLKAQVPNAADNLQEFIRKAKETGLACCGANGRTVAPLPMASDRVYFWRHGQAQRLLRPARSTTRGEK